MCHSLVLGYVEITGDRNSLVNVADILTAGFLQAHRCLIVRQLKGLQDIIGVSVVHPYMEEMGCIVNP